MSKGGGLYSLTKKERQAFQRVRTIAKQLADAKKRLEISLIEVQSAQNEYLLAMNRSVRESDKLQIFNEHYAEACDEFYEIYSAKHAEIEQLYLEVDSECEQMLNCALQASNSRDSGDEFEFSRLVQQGNVHMAKCEALNRKIKQIDDEIDLERKKAEQSISNFDCTTLNETAAACDQAIARCDAAEAEYKHLKAECDRLEAELSSARAEYARIRSERLKFRNKFIYMN